ncbi:tRNA-specific 2-thiouridylase MnmA, partial [hydrothermal vent metagenome]
MVAGNHARSLALEYGGLDESPLDKPIFGPYVPPEMTVMIDISTIDAPRIDLGVPAGARVIVAMSGGVDSSVTAALAKRSGYDVVGVTLQLYDHGVAIQKKGACCAGQDIHDARRVAEAMDFPHYVLDYETRFNDAVMS